MSILHIHRYNYVGFIDRAHVKQCRCGRTVHYLTYWGTGYEEIQVEEPPPCIPVARVVK
jgi:hypothetical protein